MSKIAVVNESNCYNLAIDKMLVKFRQEGHDVFYMSRLGLWGMDCHAAYFSAIFTPDLPKLCRDVNLLKAHCPTAHIEIGGPAPTAMPDYIERNTGIKPHLGIDERFEHVKGDFKATFTSRGCPRHCNFCLVPILEGSRIVEYDDFNIPVGKNPYILDNNILATSWKHQLRAVEMLKHVHNLDWNSGFDNRIFVKDPEKYYALYSQTHLEAWRFAYDSPEQKELIKVCADFLHSKGVNYRNIIVFCLIGGPGQTFKQSQEKLQYLIDIGVSPYPQRYRPLNTTDREYTPPDWSNGQLELLFRYYGVGWIWKSCKWEDFNTKYKPDNIDQSKQMIN